MPARKYLIVLADGQEIEAEAPDTISPDAVRADAELNYPGIKDFRILGRSMLGEAGSLASDVGRGFVRGGAFLKDLLTLGYTPEERLARVEAMESGAPAPEKTWLPQTARTNQALNEFLPTPQGDSKARQYVRSALEGVGGAAVGGPSKTGAQLAFNLGVGGASGAAAKGAEEAGAGPLGAAGASAVVGLLGAMAAGRLDPNQAELARRMFANVKPANLENAIKRMREAEAAGTPINLSQAMRGASNIDDMIEYLARTPMGDETSGLLRSQLSRARLEAGIQESRLPGTRMDLQDSANLVQQGATDRLRQVRDAANAAYRERAAFARPVAPSEFAAFEKQVAAFKARYPNVPEAQALADDVLDALTLPQPAPKAAPVGKGLISGKITPKAQPQPPEYLTDANQLKTAVDAALKGKGARLGPNATSAQRLDQKLVAELRAAWKDTIRRPNAGLEDAAAAARAVHESVGNPLRKGVVGRMAGRGATDVAEAPTGRLNSLLQRGSPEDLGELASELRGVAPRTMRDTLTSDISKTIRDAMPDSAGRIPNDFAASLRKALGAGSEGRKRIGAKLQVIEQDSGLPPGQLQEGFDKFLDYLEIASNRPSKVSGLPSAEIQEAAGRSVAADVLQAQAPWKVGLFVRRKVQDDAYAAIDKLINTPKGVEALAELAKRSPQHPRVAAAMAALFGEVGSDTPNE